MSALLAAWQGALAAEHAAVFGYQLLGPHLDAADQPAARRCEADHVAARDVTVAALLTAGQRPTPPLPDYPLPFPVSGSASARALAVRLEEGTAAGWRYLVASAAGSGDPAVTPAMSVAARAGAVRELTASAVRAVRWRRLITPAAPTVAFPGI